MALTEIPRVGPSSARLLFNGGLRNADAIARLPNTDTLVAILSRGTHTTVLFLLTNKHVRDRAFKEADIGCAVNSCRGHTLSSPVRLDTTRTRLSES